MTGPHRHTAAPTAAPAGQHTSRWRRAGSTASFALPLLLAALVMPGDAMAQSLSLDLGPGSDSAATTARLIQLTALIGLLTLAPSLLVMMTAFARIVIVLSILRSAIGAPGVPPNPVLIGLALFLTLFVMQPVLEQSWTEGLQPMLNGDIGDLAGLEAAAEPFRRFMAAHVRLEDLELFRDIAQLPPLGEGESIPWRILMPAFMVSELRAAFEIGFLIFLPFLVIDLVVASVLMGLGMMMLPPPAISLPFKLVFFVVVDGWQLISASLVRGFGV